MIAVFRFVVPIGQFLELTRGLEVAMRLLHKLLANLVVHFGLVPTLCVLGDVFTAMVDV